MIDNAVASANLGDPLNVSMLFLFDRITRDYVVGWDGRTVFTVHPCVPDAARGRLTVHAAVSAESTDLPGEPALAHVREHALTLATRMIDGHVPADNGLSTPSARPSAPTRTPPAIGPAERVSRDRLVPGLAVMRWTQLLRSPRDQVRFLFRVPCCDRTVRTTYTHEGPVAFDVLCVPCRVAYECEAWPDADGGMWARLIVQRFRYLVTSAR